MKNTYVLIKNHTRGIECVLRIEDLCERSSQTLKPDDGILCDKTPHVNVLVVHVHAVVVLIILEVLY